MIGLGTLANAAAIIVGSLLGLLIKNGISDRYEKMVFTSVGVAVMFIGIVGVVQNAGNSMMLVLSLIIGGLIGEALRLEEWMEGLGEKLKKRVIKEGDTESAPKFVEGFVSASILFVVGAMAIIGSINDGMNHDPSILYTKSILDGITSVILASSMGIGVAFSAMPILIYQGLITILASLVAPLFTETLLANISYVGNAVIFCIGFNFLFPKKIKTANLFPALFMPILLGFFIK